MELKRFVLFKFNFGNKIMTKESFLQQKNVDSWTAERGFVKTSDNILDLVEVGDFFMYVRKNDNVDLDYIQKIRTQKDGYLEYNSSSYAEITVEVLEFNKEIYLYKLQPNGDYKRYEVKK